MAEAHALIRAFERYGLVLTLRDLDGMMLSITDSKLGLVSTAVLQRVQRDGSECWFVDAGGLRIRVAYMPRSARVVSVLPLKDDPATIQRSSAHKVQATRGRGRRERLEHWTDQMEA